MALKTDLGLKARIYAAAAVPMYWVVDLVARVVHVHSGPSGGRYATVTRHGAGEVLEACGVSVDLTELFES